ncbi:hypothetical protein ABPG75_004892 [Micractinium tetrahymenae]
MAAASLSARCFAAPSRQPVRSVQRPAVAPRAPLALPAVRRAFRAAALSQESESVSASDVKQDLDFGNVADLMTAGALRSATPDQPLSSAASKLDKVTGLAVVDEQNVVVGVISIRDINRLRKQGVSMSETVGQHMSSPPIVVRPNTATGEAAAIMLARKIHRLPVVDEEGRFVGIISRTDIFQRALSAKKAFYRELATYGEDYLGVDGASQVQRSLQATFDEDDVCVTTEQAWQIKYLYDGDCSMCLSLVAMLRRQDAGQGRIKFVNIASLQYDPADNEGILYEEAMETIHAIQRDGTILKGTDALKAMYGTVGLGWAAQFGDLPIISTIVEWVYELLSKLRMPMGKGMDAVLAMRRMKMTSEGIEHCVDDEEQCAAEW